MKKRIIVVLLCLAGIAALTACEPDPVGEDRGTATATTTSQIGGFVIEEYAPGYDEEWTDING